AAGKVAWPCLQKLGRARDREVLALFDCIRGELDVPERDALHTSWARSPWAEAVVEPSATAASAVREAARLSANRLFIAFSPRLSDLLQITQDGPHGQVAADELADPVAPHTHCRTERKCHVLRLLQERAQRTALNYSDVLGRLGANVGDSLYVGHG